MSAPEMHGLPWKELLIPQVVNFSIFVGLLIYLVRKPLKQHFSGKNQEFEELRKKAEEYKVQAERQNFDVRNQMKVLEDTAGSSLETAKKDSGEMREKIVTEAKIAARKIAEESDKMAEFELARAIATLKEEFVLNATKLTEQKLVSDVNDKIKDRLNEDFINKVQVTH